MNISNRQTGMIKNGKAFFLPENTRNYAFSTFSEIEDVIKLNASNFSKEEMLYILKDFTPIGTADSTISTIYDSCKSAIRKRKIQAFLEDLDD